MAAHDAPGATSDVVIVHYNEIALKLGLRSQFTARLAENVRRGLEGLAHGGVAAVFGRIVVEVGDADVDALLARLVLMPGVANCLPGKRVEPTLEALDEAVDELLKTWQPEGSFAVIAKRADKSFPSTSPEIGARVGARIVAATGARVDLSRPDNPVHVIAVRDALYVCLRRVPACGGLPVPTGGRLLLLLSGGIDSPVAGLRMLRRGCRIDAVHFHSVPYLSAASQDKARRLAAVLARGQGPTKLAMVPFGDAQSEIVRFVPRPLRVVLYRRFMLRIAVQLAWRFRAAGLVTGESLGQVASQTLTNMSVIERAAALPVLRPLVGMDKLEIIRYARQEGTFETSILPDQDCCTLFIPKHPATAAREADVLAAESLLDVDGLVRQAVEGAEILSIAPDWD